MCSKFLYEFSEHIMRIGTPCLSDQRQKQGVIPDVIIPVIRLTEAALSAVKVSHLPLNSCKYSKKTYTQCQLPVLPLFEEHLGLDYRSFIDLLAVMDTSRVILQLDWIPHYTTPYKFIQRIPSLWLTILQKRCSPQPISEAT